MTPGVVPKTTPGFLFGVHSRHAVTTDPEHLITRTGNYETLDADRIVETIQRLSRRIEARFPAAGLASVCRRLLDVATNARERCEWIDRPLWPARIGAGVLIFLILLTPVVIAAAAAPPDESVHLLELIQGIEAGMNEIVLLGAAVFFLVTVERRWKRHRALHAIHELRAIAHIIDMHQLTKDPHRVYRTRVVTDVSPVLTMTKFELGRYLDYCSEMLSLTGKVGALYVRHFDDSVAIASVNEVEMLCTSLSGKIWQKIMALPRDDGGPAGETPSTAAE